MMKTNRAGLFLGLLSVCLMTSDGFAQDFKLSTSDTIQERLLGFTPTQKGRISKLKNLNIEVVKGRRVKVGTLTPVFFKKFDAFTKGLKSGIDGLQAGSVKEDDYSAETKDFVILAKSVEMVVTDVAKLKKKSPFFKSLLAKQEAVTAKQIKNEKGSYPKNWKAGIARFVKRAKKLRKNHPWRKAVDSGGEDELLASAFRGEGTITIIDSIAIPKKVTIAKNGKAQFFNFKHRKGAKTQSTITADKTAKWLVAMDKKGLTIAKDEPPKAPKGDKRRVAKRGQTTQYYNFVTGPRYNNDWSKQYTIDFGFGYLSVKAEWGYDLGFMVPVKIKAHTSPTEINTVNKDSKRKSTVTLSATVTDQSGSYYASAGMKGMEHGYEIPILVYAGVGCRLKVFGVWICTYTGRANGKKKKKCWVGSSASKPVNHSFDMKAPFGRGKDAEIRPAGGSWDTAKIWIPPSITRTEKKFSITKKLYAKIWAQAGVKFGGDGSASIDFVSIVDRKKGDKQTVEFSGASSTIKKTIVLPKKNKSYTFGYKLSNPQYKWVVKMTPGVQLGAKARAYKWKRTFKKEWWFDSAAFTIAKVALSATPGSNRSYKDIVGRKTFTGKIKKSETTIKPSSDTGVPGKKSKKKGKKKKGKKKKN